MRSLVVAFFVLALVVVAGCSEGRSSSGGASGPAGGGDAGGGGSGEVGECIGKVCGDPCYECPEPPCGQSICDDFETCQEALEVTCMQ